MILHELVITEIYQVSLSHILNGGSIEALSLFLVSLQHLENILKKVKVQYNVYILFKMHMKLCRHICVYTPLGFEVFHLPSQTLYVCL